jgi:acyl carrier protein
MADARNKIIQIIATECEIDPAQIVPGASLDDLGISSVDLVQVMFQIEEEFDVYLADEEIGADMESVGQLLDAVEKLIESKAG